LHGYWMHGRIYTPDRCGMPEGWSIPSWSWWIHRAGWWWRTWSATRDVGKQGQCSLDASQRKWSASGTSGCMVNARWILATWRQCSTGGLF
jgi:hypothetical protein